MEKRKLLADIRCYESDIPNVDGMGIPGEFGKIYPLDFKRFAPVLRRFILKLREMQVELPGFHHLRNSSGELLCDFPYGRSLDQDEFIFQFGSIRLAKNSVMILPKENSLSQIYGFKKLKYVFA